MKKLVLLILLLTFIFTGLTVFAQNKNGKFKMVGSESVALEVNETFTTSAEIFPFEKKVNKIFGIGVTAEIEFLNDESVVRFILLDKHFNEYLIYETYPLLEEEPLINLEQLCEETALLDKVQPEMVKLEIKDATVTLKKFTVTTKIEPGLNLGQLKKEMKSAQTEDKIQRINNRLKQKGLHWKAGKTSVSELSYSERKKLYGQSTFPPGFEYYSGGVISASTEDVSLKSAAAESPYVKSWDWRNRHGKNWITPVTDQGSCGSCWAFAATGATEAMVNVYYNQQLNLDLSEQDLVSCSGAGDCVGGYPVYALIYIMNNGIVDEGTFPYSASDSICEDKGTSPSELIKIAGRVDFGSTSYPKTEDVLKQMLIKYGPLSSALYSWSHAMVLTGYKVVEEGDRFYYGGLSTYWTTIEAGDSLIGKTVWIYKNSWASDFGDEGYVYVETPITNIGSTYAIQTPITSLVQNYDVVCEDRDGDGYYWWGIGEKPATCNGPDLPDGNDSDPTLGPLDEYGNCTLLTAAPVANFSVGQTIIDVGESIQFNDLSTGNVTSWAWIFEGGTPSVSDQKNPVVTYESSGAYDVSLTVSNSNGTDTKSTASYITVEEPVDPVGPVIPVMTYCSTNGSTEQEWIASVSVQGDVYSSGASSSGYENFSSSQTFMLESGTENVFELTPEYTNKSRDEYWQIWIDLNADGDFNDQGELVFTSSPQTGKVSGSFSVVLQEDVTTRMRISMKRKSPAGACEVFSQGEVEDYIVQIVEPVSQPPVAGFTATKTSVEINESIQFNDLSTNGPTQWQWYFPGGNPETSIEQNPEVIYTLPGEYNVTLIVSKENFDSSTEEKSNYMVVVDEVIAEYCKPSAINSSADYIEQVVIGNALNTASAGDGYLMMPQEVTLMPGRLYDVSLTPFNSSIRNYWKIWIDFNNDGDFNDSDETLLSAKNKRGRFSDEFLIPIHATGTARMRIAMRNENDMNACDDNYPGEIEDYTVNFAASAQQSSVTGTDFQDRNFEIDVYPNPVTDKVYLKTNSIRSGDFYSVYSVNGEELIMGHILNIVNTIDFSRYSPGVYFLNVYSENRFITKKIIKQ